MAKEGEKAKGQKDKKTGLKGHEQMIVWQNIDRLDYYIQQLLKKVPKNEYKMRSQIDTDSDSIGANFVEGYYSGSLSEYLRFLHYSRRSAGELRERVRRLLRIECDTYNKITIGTIYLLDRLIQSLQNKRVHK